jgi:hypothetical protein
MMSLNLVSLLDASTRKVESLALDHRSLDSLAADIKYEKTRRSRGTRYHLVKGT